MDQAVKGDGGKCVDLQDSANITLQYSRISSFSPISCLVYLEELKGDSSIFVSVHQ